jgi:hypothetical protein
MGIEGLDIIPPPFAKAAGLRFMRGKTAIRQKAKRMTDLRRRVQH